MRSPTMPRLKTREEIEAMADLGKGMPEFWRALSGRMRPGWNDRELEDFVRSWWEGNVWLSLGGRGEAAHGVPRGEDLEAGQLITVDVAVRRGDWWVDSARTFGIGTISPGQADLLDAGWKALEKAKEWAGPRTAYSEMGRAVLRYARERGYRIWKDGLSHGVGRQLHEPPQLAMQQEQEAPGWFVPGMTVALEPVLLDGPGEVFREQTLEGPRFCLPPGTQSVHFEDTLAVTAGGIRGITCPGEFF